MTSKLGVYWSVEHRYPQDYAYFRAMQPATFKIMDGGAPDYAWANANLPNSLVLARDWALSEQKSDMLANPVGTGQRHAQEWNNHQGRLGFDRAKTLILGINEPQIWDDGVPEALRLYTISLCLEAKKYGLRVGAMQLSVGWPNNNGPDTPPDWSPWHGVEQAILDNGGALVCHEYWADKGPSEKWGWWGGRALKCPWQVPIVIGECGIDMYVKTTTGEQNDRGWQGHASPEQYAAELWDYTGRMSADRRFVGNCVFASDFQDNKWTSFHLGPAYQAILASKPADTPSQPPPPTGATTPMFVVAPAGLNLREQPSVTANVIIAIPYGSQVDVIATDLDWVEARYQDNAGYVYRQFLSDTKPVATTPPTSPTDQWQRILAFIHQWEGGYQNAEWDAGNWTGCEVGKGENKGTNFGISACGYPTLDIKNLSQAEADDIFRRDMYEALGIDKQPWPLALLMMNAAVNFPKSNATAWLAQSGGDPLLYYALMLRGYRHSPAWAQAGNAWVDRMIDLVTAGSKA